MTNTLFYPFIIYGSATCLYPGVVAEDYREPRTVDRRDHVAGNYTISYKVGQQDFIEVRLPWQSDALILEWNAWWSSVSDGSLFYWCTVDSLPRYDDGTLYDDGSLYDGGDTSTNAFTLVKVDMTEFTPEREEVHGYWSVVLRMRKVV